MIKQLIVGNVVPFGFYVHQLNTFLVHNIWCGVRGVFLGERARACNPSRDSRLCLTTRQL